MILPLIGHDELRSELLGSLGRHSLPQSLLFHGAAGIGKQRLALWLAQRLICDAPVADGPCGTCRQCRMALDLTHPDVHWVFPQPRPKDSDYSPNDAKADYAQARLEGQRREVSIHHHPAPRAYSSGRCACCC